MGGVTGVDAVTHESAFRWRLGVALALFICAGVWLSPLTLPVVLVYLHPLMAALVARPRTGAFAVVVAENILVRGRVCRFCSACCTGNSTIHRNWMHPAASRLLSRRRWRTIPVRGS